MSRKPRDRLFFRHLQQSIIDSQSTRPRRLDFTMEPEMEKPKRSLNAYNLFFSHIRTTIVGSEKRGSREKHGKIAFQNLARKVSAEWKAATPEVKAHFESLSTLDKIRHKQEMEVYNAWQTRKKERELQEHVEPFLFYNRAIPEQVQTLANSASQQSLRFQLHQDATFSKNSSEGGSPVVSPEPQMSSYGRVLPISSQFASSNAAFVSLHRQQQNSPVHAYSQSTSSQSTLPTQRQQPQQSLRSTLYRELLTEDFKRCGEVCLYNENANGLHNSAWMTGTLRTQQNVVHGFPLDSFDANNAPFL
mmetsp:Transcript_9370/g.18919  ORF Transcript_9370/g.18919 Transcript_9370/m.18919 type:complete len:304 (-) Transcript_9370:708-1619(-)